MSYQTLMHQSSGQQIINYVHGLNAELQFIHIPRDIGMHKNNIWGKGDS